MQFATTHVALIIGIDLNMDFTMTKKNLSDKILNSQTNACMKSIDFLIKESLINDRPADRVISYYFKKNKYLGSRDRRFILEACFSVLRWWRWLEIIIPKEQRNIIVNNSTRKRNFDEDFLLSFTIYLKIILSASLLDEQEIIPRELIYYWAAKLKLKREILDKILKEQDIVKKGQILIDNLSKNSENIDILNVIPEWIGEEVSKEANVKDIASICQKRPPMWIRNQHKNIDELIRALEKQDIHGLRHKKIKNAICLENPKVNLYSLPEFTKGWFEVQDLASQIIGIACNASSSEWWWDACAGAGGKTLQLSSQMKNKGRIAASDIREYKLDDLKKRAKRANLSNITYFPWDGKKLPPKKQNRFDGVLVDAPCSCSGTWRRNPDAKLKIRHEEVSEMSELQLSILINASTGVKPGGVLVYATCSMFEKENHSVIKHFLTENNDFSLEPFKNPLTGKPTNGTLNIYPWDANCDATFVARFKKDN
jgi:16S rRNA (cytosine967-C5)-methyltransferase